MNPILIEAWDMIRHLDMSILKWAALAVLVLAAFPILTCTSLYFFLEAWFVSKKLDAWHKDRLLSTKVESLFSK